MIFLIIVIIILLLLVFAALSTQSDTKTLTKPADYEGMILQMGEESFYVLDGVAREFLSGVYTTKDITYVYDTLSLWKANFNSPIKHIDFLPNGIEIGAPMAFIPYVVMAGDESCIDTCTIHDPIYGQGEFYWYDDSVKAPISMEPLMEIPIDGKCACVPLYGDSIQDKTGITYRFVDGKLRHYPSSDIEDSWDGPNWKQFIYVNNIEGGLTGIPIGEPMVMNVNDKVIRN